MVILSTFCSRDGAPGDLCAETKVCAIPGDTENAFSCPLPLNCPKPGGEGGALLWSGQLPSTLGFGDTGHGCAHPPHKSIILGGKI